MELPLPMVVAEGTPAECGARYGAEAAGLIAANTEAYLRRFESRVGVTPAEARRAGAEFRAVTRRHHPRIAAMLDGVAEGAGVAVAEIYALNGRTELLYGTAISPCAADAAVGATSPPPPAGASECTSIAVLDTHTDSGHTVLAQNWDWHPAQRPYTLLLATRDERGLAVITLAEAGMLAKAGLNSAGLGVCVNMLGCDRDGRPGGVPYHVLLRAVLEAPTLTDAIRAGCASPRGASINLLIGQAYPDAEGEVIDLELVPGDVGVLHPDGGVLTHANHLETVLPGVHDTLRDLGGSSFFRSARARRLIGRAADGGKVSTDDLIAVLTDHASYPHAICRHDVASLDEEERSESIYSVILDLDQRRMSVAAGPPCTAAGYADLRLDDLFPSPSH